MIRGKVCGERSHRGDLKQCNRPATWLITMPEIDSAVQYACDEHAKYYHVSAKRRLP